MNFHDFQLLNNWELDELKNITKKVKVGFVGSCNEYYCYKNGVPMIRTTNLSKSGVKLTNLKYVTKDFHSKNKKSQLKKGDILIARHGSNGLSCTWDYDIEANCLNVVIIEPNNNKVKNLYLNYVINSPVVKKQILSKVNGSVQGVINTKSIAKLLIPYPSIKTQDKIIKVLQSIDLKIKSNLNLNQNLEKQTQLIFNNYFKNFSHYNNLKPSEMGDIPNDFFVEEIGSKMECILGGTPSRSNEEYWNGDIAWINSGKINEYRIIAPSEYITQKGVDKSATKLLPKKTTVLAITGATLGQISLLEIDSCANQSVIGIIPNKNYPYEFIYPMVKNVIKDLLRKQTGGAQQHINKNNVEKTKFIAPSNEIMEQYLNIVKPLYQKISCNCFEIEKLTQIRDTLLPKLMSGEIDVSKIEI